ncbi:hypothetical protein V6N13_091209 [Hibiscus sabdariffa]
MKNRVLRAPGKASMKYDDSSQFFTLVVHHGGFMVNSPRLKYTGKKINFFDMCHVDSMSMLEMYDIAEEVGYNGMFNMYWKQPGVKLIAKPLRIDSDVISMLATMPKQKQLHVYLEEIVPEIEGVDITGAIPNENLETEEEDDEEEDDVEEDEDYVVDEVEETDNDSGFENSDNDMPNEVCVEEVDYETLMMEMEFGKEKKENEPHLNDNDSGSDSLHSLSGNESDEDDRKKPPKCPEFNAEVDMANPQFKKGMKFSGKEILKEAIREYGIKSRHDVRFKRIDKGSMNVICKENCPWYIWASKVDPKDPTNHTWQIKSFVAEHNCVRDFKNRNVTYKWLAKTYFEQWKADPTFSIRSLQQDVQETYSYQVSLSKCLRAKNCALETVIGNHKAQYSKIYDYLAEIRTSNPGSTTILHLDNRLFQRMYICLQACKQGFKGACRPIICLDGCHIKNYYGGFLLSAVGVDGNDSLYPVVQLILDARDKPILTMMEMIRNYLMHKMAQKKEVADKYIGTLCPKIQKKLDLAIEHSARCWPTRAGDQMYQVSCGPSNQHAVDLKCFTCTCRKWDLTGIPCSHAVSCMVLENLKLESFVHSCYKIETQQLIYKSLIKPMRGPNQWVTDTTCEPVLPPKLRRPPGRPKAKRKREADEAPQTSTSRFTKRGVKIYCSKCGKPGHNKRSCKGEVGANKPIPKPSQLAGRLPRVPRPLKLQIRMPTQTRPSTSTNQPASN